MRNRRGDVEITYTELLQIFGLPTHGESGDGKSLATWEFTLPVGWGELYDFKSYAGNVDRVKSWHICADNDEVYEWIMGEINGYQARRSPIDVGGNAEGTPSGV